MRSNPNHNLIFLHIPKNGGTTLHGIINRNYPSESIFDIEVINNTRLNTKEFIALSMKEREKIKVLKGHMLFGLHKHLIGPSKYITFLRKPEDRILSFYKYVRSRPQHRLYEQIKDQSFYEFVSTCTQGDVHNAQTRWICGLENKDPQEMLEKALENIEKHFSYVGLLEHYDTSLLELSKLYNWGIPYYKQGKKSNRDLSIELDDKTVELIKDYNQVDNELYKTIEHKFNILYSKKGILKLFKHKQLEFLNWIYINPAIKKVNQRLRKLTS